MSNINILTCYLAKSENARKRKIKFDMSLITFANLKQQKFCQYSGIAFDQNTEHSFSFERIDNNVGYIDGNVIAVSNAINNERGSFTEGELIERLNTINEKIKLLKAAKLSNEEVLEIDTNRVPVIQANGIRKYFNKLILVENSFKKVRHHELQIDVFAFQLNQAKKQGKSKTQRSHIQSNIDTHKNKLKAAIKKFNADYALFCKHTKGFKTREIKYRKVNTKDYKIGDAQRTNLVERGNGLKALENQATNIKYAILGVQKFENLNLRQKQCVKVGLPTNASTVDLLKETAAYNMVKYKL
ncbi:putative Srd anti-sigma factor [Acinetobacter phage Ac42]|uniref:Srd anti-sigma factor n=1 Tax=Acinetobacter phage Ac42 TaxID=762660 RepID=UPI0001EBCC7C|nr:Srd anti-sigma factor [Acinetobacter phage Ac42]ADI96264.1 putative Srd anti-sigma factor [Acinetobacter phage Ac42]